MFTFEDLIYDLNICFSFQMKIMRYEAFRKLLVVFYNLHIFELWM